MQNTIENIEEKIRTNISLIQKNKAKLFDLLAKLKSEKSKFSKKRTEHTESIAGFIVRPTHKVMQREKNPILLKLSVKSFSNSFKGFKVSHSRLIENVKSITNKL